MKLLVTIAVFLICVSAQATDVVLRYAFFYPQTGKISLAVAEDGFARSAELETSDLPSEQQSAIAAALGWLGNQLPAGFATVDQVIISMGPEIPTAWDPETGEATEFDRSLLSSVTGRGTKGERTIQVSDASPEVRAGLLSIWDALAANPPAPAPLPTPNPEEIENP